MDGGSINLLHNYIIIYLKDLEGLLRINIKLSNNLEAL